MDPVKPRHRIVEVTDLRRGAKSYKIYTSDLAGRPLLSGLTREQAEAKLRELEQAGPK